MRRHYVMLLVPGIALRNFYISYLFSKGEPKLVIKTVRSSTEMLRTFLHPISAQGDVSLASSDLYGLTQARCDQWTYKYFKHFIYNIEKLTVWGRMKSNVGYYHVK
jgi:hypothetical protein